MRKRKSLFTLRSFGGAGASRRALCTWPSFVTRAFGALLRMKASIPSAFRRGCAKRRIEKIDPRPLFDPHQKFTGANFDVPLGERWTTGKYAVIVPIMVLCACTAPSAALTSASFDPEALQASESICINNKAYRGCCSGNGGVRNIRGSQLLCNNGNYSASCNGDISTKLRGCCSHNDGIAYAATDGTVFCINESQSKTCRIYLNDCEST